MGCWCADYNDSPNACKYTEARSSAQHWQLKIEVRVQFPVKRVKFFHTLSLSVMPVVSVFTQFQLRY